MSNINVAIAGVGDCASAFVQGLHYYRSNDKEPVGLRKPVLGGFHPKDIKVVAAFDVEERKVGKDLSEAIYAHPNKAPRLTDVPKSKVIVQKGLVLDGVGEYAKQVLRLSEKPEEKVAESLKKSGAEMLLNLLPSGAIKASEWYAKQALIAGCAFVNATPTFIASNKKWVKRFEDARVLLAGDDLIDQVGATTLHKTLLKLLSMNGVQVNETYQLDVGGSMESLDTLERTRDLKRTLKTKSVKSALPYEAEVVAGSTDYVDFLRNRRDSYFWIHGVHFGNIPVQIDLKLSTVDAPNAGSVLFDVVRAVRIAKDRGMKGAVLPICAYAFKNPPKQTSLEEAEEMFAKFIA